MRLTVDEYHVEHMDCSAEEQMVRLALEPIPEVVRLEFDLGERRLLVWRSGDGTAPSRALSRLNLGDSLIDRWEADADPREHNSDAGGSGTSDRQQRRALIAVLAVNLGYFLIESVFGILAGSMGLLADSLDMLADAAVYGLSVFAVGAGAVTRRRIAGASGWMQVTLAGLGLLEVLRRVFFSVAVPDGTIMIVVAAGALIANGASLALIYRSRNDGAHMKASWIFTSNDVVVNAGVIAAAVAVQATGSRIPDLLVGTAVFIVVIRGALRILALSRPDGQER